MHVARTFDFLRPASSCGAHYCVYPTVCVWFQPRVRRQTPRKPCRGRQNANCQAYVWSVSVRSAVGPQIDCIWEVTNHPSYLGARPPFGDPSSQTALRAMFHSMKGLPACSETMRSRPLCQHPTSSRGCPSTTRRAVATKVGTQQHLHDAKQPNHRNCSMQAPLRGSSLR